MANIGYIQVVRHCNHLCGFCSNPTSPYTHDFESMKLLVDDLVARGYFDGYWERRLQPWALTSRGGFWYVVGLDTDRDAPRAFRLSRVLGAVRAGRAGSYEIPAQVDADAMVGPPSVTDARTAVLRVRPGRGTTLRLQAHALAQVGAAAPSLAAGPARPGGADGAAPLGGADDLDHPDHPVRPGDRDDPAGWDVLELPVGDLWNLAEQVASHGPDVVAVAPPDLRTAVVRLLTGAAGRRTQSRRPAGAAR